MSYTIGLDWGGSTHAVCVMDVTGTVTQRFEVSHSAEGLAVLCRKLAAFGKAEDLPVAIERPSGIVVDSLVKAGHPVVPIHPNAVKAGRPRYRVADMLRTDAHRFMPLRPQSDAIRALRALVRGRDDLVATRVRLANQLRSLLDGFWPGAIFADIDSPIALAFLARFPTPHSARRLGEMRLAAFLARNGYRGRRSPADLLARLRAAPTSRCAEAEQDASGEIVLALAATLERLVARITTLTARIRHDVAQLPECRVVMSFPRAGQICAAPITAELGCVRERFRLPIGLQSQAARGHHLLCRQLAARFRVGQRPSIAGHAPAAAITHMPSKSSRGPGSACFGALGTTANTISPTPIAPRCEQPERSHVPWFGENGRSFVPAEFTFHDACAPGSRIADGDRRSRRAASLMPGRTRRNTRLNRDVDTGCLMGAGTGRD